MKLTLKSFNGFTLNVNGSLAAKSPIEDYGLFALPTAEEILVERGGAYPSLAVKPKEKFFTISVAFLNPATKYTTFDDVKTAFDSRAGAKQLVLTDADTGTDYYVMAACLGQAGLDGGVATFDMIAADPVVQSLVQASDTWAITASGQTRAVTISGKIEARPVFEVTPTAKTAGYAYRHGKIIYPPDTIEYPLYAIDLTGGGWNTAAWISDASKSNQVNKVGGIGAGDATIPVDTAVGGGLPATGGMGIFADNGEQIYYASLSGGNLTGVVRGIGGTTATAHADNAVIRWSKMQADCRDVQVYWGAWKSPRFITGANTASTKVVINVGLRPRVEFTLAEAIAGAGNVTAIKVATRTGLANQMLKMGSGRFEVYIGTEAFWCSAYDWNACTLTVESRAAHGTSMGAHAVGDKIVWIEYGDLFLVWGNGQAGAVDQDEDQKPVLALANLTATNWDWDEFGDMSGTRAQAWQQSLDTVRGTSHLYYGSHDDTTADPFTVMGISIQPAQVNGRWQGDTATGYWTYYNPAGFTTVSCQGEKKRDGANWATLCVMQKSNNGKDWTTVWSEASPADTNWTAWTHNGQALGGTYRWIRFVLRASLPAGSGSNGIYFEITDVTLTLDSNHTPVLAATSDTGGYHLDAKITDQGSGMWMRLDCSMVTGQTLTVDCDRQRVTLSDGSEPMAAPELDDESRDDWFPLPPGSRTLRYDETGVTNCQVVTKHRARFL